MEVIILAGGFGTRLRGVINDIPKPMAPVNQKPFLEILLDKLIKQSFNSVTLSVGYKWEVIQKHFGDKYRGLKLNYAVENTPLGTGGGIKLAMNKKPSENYLILNGDTLFDINLNEFIKYHKESKSDISIALKEMKNPHRYGTVDLEENRIVKFIEKRAIDFGIINCGIYLINNRILNELPEGKYSFEKFMETNTNRLNINGKIFSDYFIDMGIPEDYAKIQDDLK